MSWPPPSSASLRIAHIGLWADGSTEPVGIGAVTPGRVGDLNSPIVVSDKSLMGSTVVGPRAALRPDCGDPRLAEDVKTTSPEEARTPGTGWIQLAVLAVGVVVHALMLAAVGLFLMPDSVWYVQIAADIADRFDFSNPLLMQRAVGYPSLLALIFAFAGNASGQVVACVQHAMVLLIGVITMRVAWETSRSRMVMSLAGLGVVCSLQLAGYASCVMTETLYAVVVAVVLLLIVRYHGTGRWQLLALASVAAGAASAVRPYWQCSDRGLCDGVGASGLGGSARAGRTGEAVSVGGSVFGAAGLRRAYRVDAVQCGDAG